MSTIIDEHKYNNMNMFVMNTYMTSICFVNKFNRYIVLTIKNCAPARMRFLVPVSAPPPPPAIVALRLVVVLVGTKSMGTSCGSDETSNGMAKKKHA